MIRKITDNFSSEGFSINILFLPVFNPDLNTIELAWRSMERKVASKNLDFNLIVIEDETKIQLS